MTMDKDNRRGEIDHIWALPPGEVPFTLGVDLERGLDPGEVTRRRQRVGSNLLRPPKPVSLRSLVFNQFRSVVVALLGVAGGLSLLFGRWLEGVAVGVVLLVNSAIGFFTELRAVRSMEALRRLGHTTARVKRDGQVQEIPGEDLVPGDVVLLEAGDVVSADVRLVEASKLQADESTLTGESMPVGKSVDAIDVRAPLAERRCMVFRGSSLTRGSGAGVVVATGMTTQVGRIVTLTDEAEDEVTPLERRLQRLGRGLVGITLAIASVTILVGLLRGQETMLMLETGIALAVAAIPEGLPIVATLCLARGMLRMARRHALVNRLSAVETLGATSVILTDKTGTLTENRMTVVHLALAEHDVVIAGQKGSVGSVFQIQGAPIGESLLLDVRAALEIGVLCNNASLDDRGESARSVGDPLEIALLVAGAKAGLSRPELVALYPEEREDAFEPQRRAMATLHRDGAMVRVAIKGAPEAVLPWCTRQLVSGEEVDLEESGREAWLERSRSLAREGLRLLAVARGTVPRVEADPFRDLTLIALTGLLDPPRVEVGHSLQECRDAGLHVVMVTGDQAGTALSIARAVHLVTGESRVLEGKDLPCLDTLSEEERDRLAAHTVFARVDPEQKLRLIELHQGLGAVVAMTGDGVNDAPALRKADIGVAMGRRGTQVAREAADMVLLDDSFATIVAAISQGRIIFTNIRRFVLYLLSCNISEILVVFGAAAFGAPLPVLPLQILFLNLVTDVFPALALGLGEGAAGVMKRPPRDPRQEILERRHFRSIAGYGVLIATCVLAAFLIALGPLDLALRPAVTVAFLTLGFSQVFHVFNMRERGPWHRSETLRNRWVLGAVVLCTVLLLASVTLPSLARILGTASLGSGGWGLVVGMSLVPLVVGQVWLSGRGRAGKARQQGASVPD